MTIRDYIDRVASKNAATPAQKFFEGDRLVVRSYGEFKSRVIRASAIAQGLRLIPGRDNVALMLENCPEWEEIYLGLSSVGFTVVPMDPKLKESEVLHILKDSGAAAIFAGAKQRPLLSAVAASLSTLRICVFVGGDAADNTGGPGGNCLFFGYRCVSHGSHNSVLRSVRAACAGYLLLQPPCAQFRRLVAARRPTGGQGQFDILPLKSRVL